ncbi:hypothetical protein AAG906_007595 [Vitis piasezkii]
MHILLCLELFRSLQSSTIKPYNVPLPLFGGSGNYASALYISAVKANALDIVEFVEASNRSEKFSELMKNLSVPRDARVKAVT